MATVGTLGRIHRYPLKSAQGEQVASAAVGPAGLDGDRRWAVTGDDGRPVTARTAPDLRHLVAGTDSDGLVIAAPGGSTLRGADALAALASVVGRPVRVEESEAPHLDVAPVHLVSAGASAAPDAPGGCDPEPRANLVLDLSDVPGAERGWVGRRLRIGDVELRVTRTPKQCLGVYAEVLVPGQVRAGDDVELLDD
jgi:uncharacterized protein YcbX